MSEIQPFTFPTTGQLVRTVLIDGEPWFVARDAGDVLDLGNVSSSLALLDDDEKGVHTMETPGGTQRFAVINEPGLYSLILRSRKPEAKTFKRWVTHEVLPAIRKTGSYSVAELGRKQLAQMVLAAEEERERLAGQVAELEPDAARARQTLDANGLALVGTVAKRFRIKERALRAFLWDEGLLIRGGSRHNEPMARYVPAYFEVKTTMVAVDPDRPEQARNTTYVTPKGEDLIWKRLYRAGLVSSPTPPPRQLDLLTR